MSITKKMMVALAIAGSFISVSAFADTVKIGMNVPLTGFAAVDGKSALLGAEIAVEQANAEGGVHGTKIELIYYDDQASSKQSAHIANKLIGQDEVAVGISGSYSGATLAASRVFQSEAVPYISAFAVHRDITKSGDYIFRTSSVGEVQGRAGARLIGEILGKKRVVIITVKDDFGQSLAAGFTSKAADFGIEIVNEYKYSIKDRQFGSIVAGVKSDRPDAIYASGYVFTAAPLVRQLRAARIDVPVIGQQGYDSEKFIETAGSSSEGVLITTSLDRDSSVSEAKEFISAFEASAGYKADMTAASAHTAATIAIAAMRKAGTTDHRAIRDAIAATNMVTSTGDISFNEIGEPNMDIQVQIVKNGDWHHYAVIDDPDRLAPLVE